MTMSVELATSRRRTPTSSRGVEHWGDNEGAGSEGAGLLAEDDDDDQVEVVDLDYTPWTKASMVLMLLALTAVGYFIGVGMSANGDKIAPVPRPQQVQPPVPVQLTAEEIKQQQIANYINGTALLVSVHITHHAGTSVCAIMKKLGPAPAFACNWPGDGGDWPDGLPTKTRGKSWPYNDTATYVEKLRPLFHFMGQEYHLFANLQRTNWEYVNLASLIVMRHPLERFLAGGKCGEFHAGHAKDVKGDPTNETQGRYWEYANAKCADNFALRVLTNKKNCVNGSETSVACLEGAKSLLKRFTFILDQACLNDSIVELGKILHLNITEKDFETRQHKPHPLDIRERLGNDTLYEYLQQRFRRDIELYEWSKKRSIVKCRTMRRKHSL